MAKTKSKSANPRAFVKQTDVPSVGLEKALAIAKALANNYAGSPTKPLNVAAAMNIKPSSSAFRMLCGASIAYGLTNGGYNAKTIELTELGKTAIRPMHEGQDLAARRKAFLQPRVIGQFLRQYDNSPIPREQIAINVLEEMSVPRERGANTFELIVKGAEELGLVKTIKDQDYVNLEGIEPNPKAEVRDPVSFEDNDGSPDEDEVVSTSLQEEGQHTTARQLEMVARKKRVYIAHGKNKSFLNPISELLQFGELKPVMSAEEHTVSKPVPDKVLIDMRSCGAAIIHVDAERLLLDTEGKQYVTVNENVLIEIGAAMALYGRRFILLVHRDVALPSNLQGLYEVRYDGKQLDGTATIRLLKAINDIKNHHLPEEGQ